jgi:hypothetical protein
MSRCSLNRCSLCDVVMPNIDYLTGSIRNVCIPCGEIAMRHLNPKWEVSNGDRKKGRLLYSLTSQMDKAVIELLERRLAGHCPQCGNKHA